MQAYLIMAHNDFNILEKIIKMIDYSNHDIFIHVDSKVKEFDFEYFKSIPKQSNVVFTDRISVKWGDCSMIEAEYLLLNKAMEYGNYTYYHLISGADMPLKSAEKLYEFYETNYPNNFIHFANKPNKIEESRIKHYHFFTGRRNIFNRIGTKVEQIIQEILKIDRLNGKKIYRGSQWYSITDEFAKYLTDNQMSMKNQLKHTLIPDEFFVQMSVINSPYKDKLYKPTMDDDAKQNMHFVDWERGNPYTLTEEDFDLIIWSGCMFARKFTSHNNLSNMVFETVNNEGKQYE